MLLGALPLALQATTPRVSTCYPPGGQQGTEVETVIGGSLKDARTILFDEPGIEVVSLQPEAGKVKAKLKIAADAAPGEHRFRVVTESGISELRIFLVTPFPIVEEGKKTKPTDREPLPVALTTTVYGRTPGDDQDRYVVEVKKGQRITAEVVASHLQGGALFDSALSIEKEDGTKLAESDDTAFGRQDPVTSVLAPEDGKYIITVRDSTNLGEGDCIYFMHIGNFAQPLAVYPSGGPAGSDVKLTFLGDASGPLEKTVKLPDQANPNFAVYGSTDGAAPMPNPFRISKFPNVLEAEPNDDIEHATAAPDVLPIAVNGVIEKKNDIDFFKFTAKKGQAYDLTVYARVLRSPLDSVLSIYNEKGAKLASNDDEGEPDSHLRWTAPADGAFFLSVNDQLNRGGSIYTYRVEIVPVEPKVVTYLPEITQNQNQDRRAIVVPQGNRFATLVKIRRTDFAGDLTLEPKNVPDGVSVAVDGVDKSVDTVVAVFEAKPDAKLDQKLMDLTAKPVEAPKEGVELASAVAHTVDLVGGGNQKPYYSVTEDKLAAAVAAPIPVKISLVPYKAPILQNGAMNLKIHAERGDYKGPISLSLIYTPPGIGFSVVNIKEGESDAEMPISANDKAALKTWKVCVVGNADFGQGGTYFSTELRDLTVAPGLMDGAIQRTFIDQGDSTQITVKLTPKADFEGKAKLELMGLPGGVTAEPVEITKDSTEVKFNVKANDKAIVGQHRQLFCQFTLMKDGESMQNSFGLGGVLRVDKGAIAKNTEK